MSRATLAHEAGISLDSLNKCLSGHREFSPRLLIPIGLVLAVEFDEVRRSAVPAITPEPLGAYARIGARWLENRYVALRYAFQREGAIMAFSITIRWDEDENCLVHHQSFDFNGPITQRGQVAISSQSGHISLVTNELGRFELSILGRPAEDGRLQGILTMFYHRRDMLTPGASPLVLIPAPHDPDTPAPACGEIEAGHPNFAHYARLLDMVEIQGFAKLAKQSGL